ncbi:MAG: hypothetical protein N2112_14800 [Gemmataceae bacterium]|jgi:hypothetical protein|nr:hypothetical protein [Gemmataceae bacterium]
MFPYSKSRFREDDDALREDYVDAEVAPIKVRLSTVLIFAVTSLCTFFLCAGGPIPLFFSIPAYRLAQKELKVLVPIDRTSIRDWKLLTLGKDIAKIITVASVIVTLGWITLIVAAIIKDE